MILDVKPGLRTTIVGHHLLLKDRLGLFAHSSLIDWLLFKHTTLNWDIWFGGHNNRLRIITAHES
jgi:hypothetical protein